MVYSSKSIKPKKRILSSRKLLITAAVVLALAVSAAALYRHHQTTDAAAKADVAKKVTPRPITAKTSTPSSTTSKNSQPGNSTNDTAAAPASNVQLIKPFGTLVSNHKPGQNGSPLEEGSVCNTTPGASCSITFTKDGVTKSLPAKTADGAGAAYWSSWTPQSVGLTSGSWMVSAVATLGQQSASTQDTLALEISP